ncbi:MAG: DUF2165 family protein [Parvularculaceae bacterium]|nr:DUF2165 family protein [Parvularculaceae bacterium]
MVRLLKIVLVTFAGLQGLIYCVTNFVNWKTANAVVGQVIAQGEKPYYAHGVIPSFTDPAFATLVACVIVAGEFLVGALCLVGALKMLGAMSGPAAGFNASKSMAIWGCGMALIVWFGIFTVIGGAAFQMWQTGLGRDSLVDAHHYLTPSGLILLFLAMKDE